MEMTLAREIGPCFFYELAEALQCLADGYSLEDLGLRKLLLPRRYRLLGNLDFYREEFTTRVESVQDRLLPSILHRYTYLVLPAFPPRGRDSSIRFHSARRFPQPKEKDR